MYPPKHAQFTGDLAKLADIGIYGFQEGRHYYIVLGTGPTEVPIGHYVTICRRGVHVRNVAGFREWLIEKDAEKAAARRAESVEEVIYRWSAEAA